MTKLIFVRHGEAEGNVERFFHGHYNSNMTYNGHMQARATAKLLSKEPLDVIYSSDLRRAIDTAGYVARCKGMDILLRHELREINGGHWENLMWDELPEKYPLEYEHWLSFPHLLHMPGGERMQDFACRVQGAINEIITANSGKTIAIFTHGTVIKTMMCLWKGFSLADFPRLKWHDNASVTMVDFLGDHFHIVQEGYNAHLGELSTLNKQDWWKANSKG